MKHLMTAILTLTLSFPVLAKEAKPHYDVIVKINGMVCDVCAQSVKKTFMKENTVNDVSINLDTGEVSVDVKDGQTLDDATIKKVIDYSGYDIVKITR